MAGSRITVIKRGNYGGDSAGATAARGDASNAMAARIANAIRALKRDETGPKLQKEFFEKVAKPIR